MSRTPSVPRSSNPLTFVFDSRDEHIRTALLNNGWTQVSRGPALLKYTASDVGLVNSNFQIANHLKFTRSLTTKEALANTLSNFSRLFPEISTDDFFPRQFSEISDLHLFFLRYSAYLALKSSHRKFQNISPHLDVLNTWISEISPHTPLLPLFAASNRLTPGVFDHLSPDVFDRLSPNVLDRLSPNVLGALDHDSVSPNVPDSLLGALDPLSELIRQIIKVLEESDNQLKLLSDDRPVFVVKPGGSSRGKGVFFSDEWSEISGQMSDRHRVVQLAVNRPLLADDRKFDLRVWVLVRQKSSELEIYVYRNFYARLCAEKFEHGNFRAQKFVTNWSTNKKYFSAPEASVAQRAEIENFFGSEISSVWSQIQKIILHTLQAGYLEICGEEKVGNFELLGFDVIVDENLRVWLLEVNASPACDFARCPALALEAANMADGLVRLLGGADAAAGWDRLGQLRVQDPARSADLGVVEGKSLMKRTVRRIDRMFEGARARAVIHGWMLKFNVEGKLKMLVDRRKQARKNLLAGIKSYARVNQIRKHKAATEIQEFFRSRNFRVRSLVSSVFNRWISKRSNRVILYNRVSEVFRHKRSSAILIQTALRSYLGRKRRNERKLVGASNLGQTLLNSFKRSSLGRFSVISVQEISGLRIFRGLLAWRLRRRLRRAALISAFREISDRSTEISCARKFLQAACRSHLTLGKLRRRSEISRNFRSHFPPFVRTYLAKKNSAAEKIAKKWIFFLDRKKQIVACCRKFLATNSMCRRKILLAKQSIVCYFRSFLARVELIETRRRHTAGLRIFHLFKKIFDRKFLLLIQQRLRSYLRMKDQAAKRITNFFLFIRKKSVVCTQTCDDPVGSAVADAGPLATGDLAQPDSPTLPPVEEPPTVLTFEVPASPVIVEPQTPLSPVEAQTPLSPVEAQTPLSPVLKGQTPVVEAQRPRLSEARAEEEEDVAELMASLIGNSPVLTDRKFFAPRGVKENLEKLAKALIGKKETKKVSLRRSKLNMTLI